ncbi:hypothetical protein EDC56_2859 [Sinobacterium caligoides]|uniref:Uncharacterized protein n=2 Tax=Sinobacterium caligoides TaxID=933926 RepID=A0A3N2DK83_9GAMM|nr:hypothetical protein EDC56_2859 [Sinobacterium caligoides]
MEGTSRPFETGGSARGYTTMIKTRRDTVTEADYTIVDYGWDDRLAGKRETDNPYPINNWKHYDWEKGWKMADITDEIDHYMHPAAQPKKPSQSPPV